MIEDHASVNSESDSELVEEDEIGPQPAPGPASQQPVGGEIWMSDNSEIEWSSCPWNEHGCQCDKVNGTY